MTTGHCMDEHLMVPQLRNQLNILCICIVEANSVQKYPLWSAMYIQREEKPSIMCTVTADFR